LVDVENAIIIDVEATTACAITINYCRAFSTESALPPIPDKLKSLIRGFPKLHVLTSTAWTRASEADEIGQIKFGWSGKSCR
jgi:hypothetical protein